jgi:hypothetical protein
MISIAVSSCTTDLRRRARNAGMRARPEKSFGAHCLNLTRCSSSWMPSTGTALLRHRSSTPARRYYRQRTEEATSSGMRLLRPSPPISTRRLPSSVCKDTRRSEMTQSSHVAKSRADDVKESEWLSKKRAMVGGRNVLILCASFHLWRKRTCWLCVVLPDSPRHAENDSSRSLDWRTRLSDGTQNQPDTIQLSVAPPVVRL